MATQRQGVGIGSDVVSSMRTTRAFTATMPSTFRQFYQPGVTGGESDWEKGDVKGGPGGEWRHHLGLKNQLSTLAANRTVVGFWLHVPGDLARRRETGGERPGGTEARQELWTPCLSDSATHEALGTSLRGVALKLKYLRYHVAIYLLLARRFGNYYKYDLPPICMDSGAPDAALG